jgi:hypothetical protein
MTAEHHVASDNEAKFPTNNRTVKIVGSIFSTASQFLLYSFLFTKTPTPTIV